MHSGVVAAIVRGPSPGRGAAAILPPLTEEATKQVILLTGETLFKDRDKLKELPVDAEFEALIENRVHGLVRSVVNGVDIYSLDVGNGVRVPIQNRAQVHEMLWQLARPVDLSTIRVLALEPGATGLLKRSRPPGPTPGRVAVEAVDPDRLPHMLGAVARGTVVISDPASNAQQGAPDIRFVSGDRFVAGYYHDGNADDHTYVRGLLLGPGGAIEASYRVAAVDDNSIGRPTIATHGDKALVCASRGDNRPPEDGVACAWIDAVSGEVYWRDKVVD